MPTVEKGRFAVFSKVTELDCARRGEDGRTPARGTADGNVSLPQFPEAVRDLHEPLQDSPVIRK